MAKNFDTCVSERKKNVEGIIKSSAPEDVLDKIKTVCKGLFPEKKEEPKEAPKMEVPKVKIVEPRKTKELPIPKLGFPLALAVITVFGLYFGTPFWILISILSVILLYIMPTYARKMIGATLLSFIIVWTIHSFQVGKVI